MNNTVHIRRAIAQILLFACIGFLSHAQSLTNLVRKPVADNVNRYLDEKAWNDLFPNRRIFPSSTQKKRDRSNDFYSFRSFITAAAYFPEFLSNGDAEINKRELSAFLANMAYETGGGWEDAPGGYYKWGLLYVEEKGCEQGCPVYTDPNKPLYPAIANQSYHGRGGLQLSWNYNYGQFSEAFFGTKDKLLQEPALVSTDPVLSFASAIWFWITAQYPKPSCHAIITNTWQPNAKDSAANRLPGYGAIVNVINGGIECGKDAVPGTQYRYGYYEFFCRYFHVSPGDNMFCATQKPFGVAP